MAWKVFAGFFHGMEKVFHGVENGGVGRPAAGGAK